MDIENNEKYHKYLCHYNFDNIDKINFSKEQIASTHWKEIDTPDNFLSNKEIK